MNNTLLIRISAMAVAGSLVALASTAAAGRLPKPPGAGEQPLSAGVHVLDLVSLKQARPGYKYLPRIEFRLPSGWFNNNGWAVNNGGSRDWTALAFWDVDKVYPTGCRWQGKPKIDPGRTVYGLTQALATRPLRHASRPRIVELAGFHGRYLRWSVPSKIDFSHCGRGYFESWTGRGWATDRWEQGPGQVDRLWILDIHGKRLVIDANYLSSATRAQRTELDRIVHSIKFLSASRPRSTASASSGQSKRAWRRNSWHETRGVLHAYFLLPAIHSHYAWAALLKVRTHTTKLRFTCQLRLGGSRRFASWYYKAKGRSHTVAFSNAVALATSSPCRCHLPYVRSNRQRSDGFRPPRRFARSLSLDQTSA